MISSSPIVIDNGSGFCKAGFAGEESPASVFQNVIGHPKIQQFISDAYDIDDFIGDEATSMRGILSLQYPIKNGVIINWEDMEKVWNYTFQNALRVLPKEHLLLITESPLNPLSNREKMVEIMFEKFGIPGMYVSSQAILSLYASGRISGIVLDSGHGVTHIVPVYEGHKIKHAVGRISLAGGDLTDYLKNLLIKRGYNFVTSSELEIVRDIKEKLCYVVLDPEKSFDTAEHDLSPEKDYVLPDGQIIHLGIERIQCPEAMFTPELIGRDMKGIDDAIVSAIEHCDIDLRRELFQNIMLSGGNTMFKGIDKRLNQELSRMVCKQSCVRIIAPKERLFSSWIGGSILASLNSFNDIVIKKEEYQEIGSNIVHVKCR